LERRARHEEPAEKSAELAVAPSPEERVRHDAQQGRERPVGQHEAPLGDAEEEKADVVEDPDPEPQMVLVVEIGTAAENVQDPDIPPPVAAEQKTAEEVPPDRVSEDQEGEGGEEGTGAQAPQAAALVPSRTCRCQ